MGYNYPDTFSLDPRDNFVSLSAILGVKELILKQLSGMFIENKGIEFSEDDIGEALSLESLASIYYFINQTNQILAPNMSINLQDGKYIYDTNVIDSQTAYTQWEKLDKLFQMNRGELVPTLYIAGLLGLDKLDSIRPHIRSLREQGNFDPGDEIENIKGFGYVFGDDTERSKLIEKYKQLSHQHSKLLKLFRLNRGVVLSKKCISDELELGDLKSVRPCVSKLRSKGFLDEDEVIYPVHSVGYLFGSQAEIDVYKEKIGSTEKKIKNLLIQNKGSIVSCERIYDVSGLKNRVSVDAYIERFRGEWDFAQGEGIYLVHGLGFLYGTKAQVVAAKKEKTEKKKLSDSLKFLKNQESLKRLDEHLDTTLDESSEVGRLRKILNKNNSISTSELMKKLGMSSDLEFYLLMSELRNNLRSDETIDRMNGLYKYTTLAVVYQ